MRAIETKGDRPETSCRISHSDLPVVAFDEEDVHDGHEHYEALIITLSMVNCMVRKILVDTEASTEQIKVVLQLESPEKPKDVQRLAGKVAALSRFISRSSDKCRLVYDILRKSQKFEWTVDHEQAFRELKHYLSTPPLLSKTELGEPLFLYLAITKVAVSEVLVREQDKEQTPVYYPELSGRMSKWSIHLSGYDIIYDPRTAIKSQALADFVSDFSPAIQNRAGEEILTLKGKEEGDLIAQAVRYELKATNNEIEYEALILGMQLALELGVRNLQIFSDSLLIVNHVNDEFIARDSKMIAYLKVAKELKQKFRDCKLKRVPRDQNVEADALATLGATFKPTELSNIPIAHILEPSIQKLEEADNGELEDQQDGAVVLPTTYGQTAVQPNDQSADQTDDWDWRTPYLDWLRYGKLPDDKKEIRGFKMKTSRFILIDNVLFRKSLAGPYLRCLDKQEAHTVLHALHSGECGSHAGARVCQIKPSYKATSGPQQGHTRQNMPENATPASVQRQ
ncbi:uncharacterized protein LOC141595241 [Silene latifolia]|uniref:uncharacterized protein LOC141595241 n=1 Tax=Silene latifolia TaxID=37657 RepID=UPI003D7850AA